MRNHLFSITAAALALVTTWATAPATARADERIASTGIFAEGGIGGAFMLGAAADASLPGPVFELRAGYELTPWLALGLQLGASTHEAVVPPPPVGEYFQLYRGGVDARVGTRLGAVALFAEGGAGVAMISSNILEKVQILEPGERFALYVTAGGGAEYQLRNRHYAVGVAGGWLSLPGFAQSQGVSTRAYLRYTY